MEALLRLLPNPQPVLVRYGITVAMVLLTFGLRIGIEERAGTYGFIIFIPAIVASALLFDRGSGFLALLMSAGLISALLPWDRDQNIHIAALASFIIIGIGLVLLGEGLHRALEKAHQSEQENELLLRELTHRVKNKFAMISSLMRLQARHASPEARAALEMAIARVRVIGEIHDQLQIAATGAAVELATYLDGLSRSIAGSLDNVRPIAIVVSAEPLHVPPQKALTLGLIVNELVINALKYAFPEDRSGRITISVTPANGNVVMAVADNGVGCPADTRKGLGTQIVTLLAAQLGGNPRWENGNPGCRVSINLPATSLTSV